MMKIITPIILIAYNRFNETKLILRNIFSYKINKLYIFQDGSKDKNDKNHAKVSELLKNYKKSNTFLKQHQLNLGLKKNVITSLNQVFQTETEAIILEDDCLANLDFFNFAQILLKKYSSNKKIYQFCGFNLLSSLPIDSYKNSSYIFSRYGSCWAWATWRNRWEKMLQAMELFNKKKFRTIKFQKKYEHEYWQKMWEKVHQKKLDSWAFIWDFCKFYNSAINITPRQNLVQNLGFESDATHTRGLFNLAKYKKSQNLGKIIHPQKIDFCDDYDEIFSKICFKKHKNFNNFRQLLRFYALKFGFSTY